MLYKKGEQIATFKVDETWEEFNDEYIDTPIGEQLYSYTLTEEYQNIIEGLDLQKQISKFTENLNKTDYIANKLAEAVSKYISTSDNTDVLLLREKYALELANREMWRKEIDSLQEKLKNL